jgi:hypothetical protein
LHDDAWCGKAKLGHEDFLFAGYFQRGRPNALRISRAIEGLMASSLSRPAGILPVESVFARQPASLMAESGEMPNFLRSANAFRIPLAAERLGGTRCPERVGKT